jgi:hypothetical protein
MTNNNNPQLSRMDLANHCASFLGLSLLNTRACTRCLLDTCWAMLRSVPRDGIHVPLCLFSCVSCADFALHKALRRIRGEKVECYAVCSDCETRYVRACKDRTADIGLTLLPLVPQLESLAMSPFFYGRHVQLQTGCDLLFSASDLPPVAVQTSVIWFMMGRQ